MGHREGLVTDYGFAGETCGRCGFYLTSEILGLLGGRCDQGRPGGRKKG